MLILARETLWNRRATQVVCIFLFALMLTGCMAMGQGANLTPDEQALREDAQVFNETVVGGAATGALVTGLGCALLGGSLEQCAIAAGSGAALGGIAGYMTATSQRAAKQEVRQAEIITKDIVEENQKIKVIVAKAEKVLETNRAEAKKLKALIASKKAKAGEMEALQARMESSSATLNELVTNLEKKRAQYIEAADSLDGKGQDTAELRRAVKDMESQIALLVGYRTALEESLRVEVMG